MASHFPNLDVADHLKVQQRTLLFKQAIENIINSKSRLTIDDFKEVVELYSDTQAFNLAQMKLAGRLMGESLGLCSNQDKS